MSDTTTFARVLGGGMDQSVACVLLAYGKPASVETILAGLKPADRALCQSFLNANRPRHKDGTTITSRTYEASYTKLDISSINDRARYEAQTLRHGDQDGGNGSGGGDAVGGNHYLDMVMGDSGATFWKIDSPPVDAASRVTTKGVSPQPVVDMLNDRSAPGLARIFASHSDAMSYRVLYKFELDSMFAKVLIVAVAVNGGISPPADPPAGGVDM